MSEKVGTPPDRRITRRLPDTTEAMQAEAQDMVISLFNQGFEFYRVMVDRPTGKLVADGWRERPEMVAEYQPPSVLEVNAGMAMDLTPADRERMRAIVRKTHAFAWREHPTDAMCDELIDSLGPQVAMSMVKKAVDSRLL